MRDRLKNKHLQVKLVNDEPELPQLPPAPNVDMEPTEIQDTIVCAGVTVGAVIVTYMATDTIRKSIIEIVKGAVR